MEYILFFLLLLTFFYSLNNVTRSPSYFFPFFLSFIYVYTFIGSQLFDFAEKIPFSEQLVTNTNLLESGLAYFLASIFFICGIFFSKKKFVYGKYSIKNNFNQKVQFELNINSAFSFLFASFVLIFSFFTFELDKILYRDTYAFEINEVMLNIHRLLFLIGVFLCAFIDNRFLKYALLFLIIIFPFSMNSRLLILGILLFFSGLYFKNKFLTIFDKLLFIGMIVISIISTLGLRSMEFQGLIPNLINLFKFNFNTEDILSSVNYVTSFSVFAAQYTIDNDIGDFKSFTISINPMFGRFLDTEYMINNTKINMFSPAPAIPLLYNQGLFIMFLYYIFCGFVFNKILVFFRYNSFYSVFFGLFLLFTFLNTQYLLRESVRLLYYSIFFAFLLILLKKILVKKVA